MPEIMYAVNPPPPPPLPDAAVFDILPEEFLQATKKGESRIYIPKSEVSNVEIIEADNINQVHEKVWRFPTTSSPDKGSNTVMLGHRYRTLGGEAESTFYHLPKLVPGDKIYVAWENNLYVYIVDETETVPPSKVSILNPTELPILTIYTCTPLWSATDRFVVKSSLLTVISFV